MAIGYSFDYQIFMMHMNISIIPSQKPAQKPAFGHTIFCNVLISLGIQGSNSILIEVHINCGF